MIKRIEKLMSQFGEDYAVFIKGYANIFYYSGFTSEDAYLLITREKRLLITDGRYFVQAREEAPLYEVVDIRKGWSEIFKLISATMVAFTDKAINYSEYQSIALAFGVAMVPAQGKIDYPRRIKDASEIELIRQAEEIGDRAFEYVLPLLHVGMTELDVAILLEGFMRRNGAVRTSFNTICASGVRSCMPHGIATDKVIEKGDFLTMDFGCVYKGYCSDMTRTVVFGSPSEKQREIYDTVLRAQLEAIESLSVGMACADIDTVARRIIMEAGYEDNFTHSLGHSVGIDIHELPVFSPKSSDNLCVGNVMSVEPGIYIDNEMGVRIEDLIAVTENGIINLTSSPKELIII